MVLPRFASAVTMAVAGVPGSFAGGVAIMGTAESSRRVPVMAQSWFFISLPFGRGSRGDTVRESLLGMRGM
jgi:hypothetical protein